MEKRLKLLKKISFQIVATRNKPLFKIILWIFTNLLEILWGGSFILMLIFLGNRFFTLSFIFFLLWIFLLFLDKMFSIQRLDIIIQDIDTILKKLKEKDYDILPFILKENLINAIKDFMNYEISRNDYLSLSDLQKLIIYLENFILYKNFKNRKNIRQLTLFCQELLRIFENKKFSQIPHLIQEDFKILKSQSDYKIIISNIKSNKSDFKVKVGILEMIDEFKEKEKNVFKTFWLWFIELLKILQTYKTGVIVLLIIIFLILFSMGKIDLSSVSQLISVLLKY